jgi:endogenous inhibitor of DNA gyrase (YacG/DUF329 family)
MSMNVACPTCKKQLEWIPENIYRPFCSKKCQLIDLGEWFDETRRLEGEVVTSENQPKKNFSFDE